MKPPKVEAPSVADLEIPADVASPEPVVVEQDADDQDPDPRAWRLVDEFTPRDGTLIEAKADPDMPDDQAAVLKWRITRRRNFGRRRWVVVGFWANALTNEEVVVEPFVWRLPQGFLLPGMVA
jgi:hypothetical protein